MVVPHRPGVPRLADASTFTPHHCGAAPPPPRRPNPRCHLEAAFLEAQPVLRAGGPFVTAANHARAGGNVVQQIWPHVSAAEVTCPPRSPRRPIAGGHGRTRHLPGLHLAPSLPRSHSSPLRRSPWLYHSGPTRGTAGPAFTRASPDLIHKSLTGALYCCAPLPSSDHHHHHSHHSSSQPAAGSPSFKMVLEKYTYVFAIGTFFALLDAYNNGASTSIQLS